MKFDPRAAAIANTSMRSARLTDVLTNPEMAAFHSHASGAKMSVNIDGLKASTFIAVGRVLSTFEQFVYRHRPKASVAKQQYARHQGVYGPRRGAFERAFGAEHQMLYGAANTGNLGTLGRYGQFCMVLDPTAEDADDCYVLPKNSLGTEPDEGYVSHKVRVKTRSLTADIALWGDCADLIAETRSPGVTASAVSTWPDVVCQGEHSFIEVLAAMQPISAVQEVRVAESYADILNRRDRAQRRATRRGRRLLLPTRQANELQGWRTMQTNLKVRTIP